MAEPIQSASAGDHDEEKKLPDNAEDRKAAAALDALNANAMSQENGESASKQPSAADQDALGKAISRLGNSSGTTNQGASAGEKSQVNRDAEAKKKIKLAAEDVNFLVRDSGQHAGSTYRTNVPRWHNWTCPSPKQVTC